MRLWGERIGRNSFEKSKLYLPSEVELLRELNQEYQALEAGKTGEENSGDMKEE